MYLHIDIGNQSITIYSDSYFQVTVTAAEDCVYLCWQLSKLNRIFKHRTQLHSVLTNIIGELNRILSMVFFIARIRFVTFTMYKCINIIIIVRGSFIELLKKHRRQSLCLQSVRQISVLKHTIYTRLYLGY